MLSHVKEFIGNGQTGFVYPIAKSRVLDQHIEKCCLVSPG